MGKNHELLTIKQTAEYLQISPRSIYNKIRPGNTENPFPVKAIKIGNLWRFRKSDLENYVSSL